MNPTSVARIPMRNSKPFRLRCRFATTTSTATPDTLPRAPPLLLKLRRDLKDAMRSKDTSRLDALRGILAEVTNASKTSNIIKTDMQMLSLLRKRSAASRAASVEFKQAGREDLKEKEDEQVAMLEEYSGGVEMVSEEEVRRTVEQMRGIMQTEGVKVDKGNLIRRLVGPEGAFKDKPVDRAMVAKVVQEVLGGS